jgi:hypothetical protein
MKHWSDSVVLWIVTVAAACGFALGAVWSRWIEPPVAIYSPAPAVTAQTSAPAVVAEVGE